MSRRRRVVTLTFTVALAWGAVAACRNDSPASPICSQLLACCGSLATPDLRSMCMSKLPSDTSDGATCSAQLSAYMAQGECADGGAGAPDSGGVPQATCMAGSFCASGAFQYCRVVDDAGACTSSYYLVGGQTFACVSCTDMSGCGDAARSFACSGGPGPDAGSD